MLGLEIGSCNIKLLESRKKNHHYTIEKSAIIPTPEGTIIDGTIRDTHQLSQILKKEIKTNQYRAKNLAIVIDSSEIIRREIRVEKMPAHDLKSILELQYQEYLQVDISDYQVTYKVMGQVEKDHISQQEILIVAAPKKILHPLVEIADSLKLKIRSINIGSDSVANLFHEDSFTVDMKEQEAMVLDIGGHSTAVTLISAGLGVLNKDIKFGLRDITLGNTKAILEQKVAAEIRRLLQFHFSRGRQDSIEKIYITGGGAHIEHIDHYMTQILGIPCVAGISLDITQIEANQEIKENGAYFANILGLISGL